MTREIDETQLIKDFHGGKRFTEISLKYGISMGTITNRLRKLGLRRNRLGRELFSAEEKDFMRKLMGTYLGRKQLLNILRGE